MPGSRVLSWLAAGLGLMAATAVWAEEAPPAADSGTPDAQVQPAEPAPSETPAAEPEPAPAAEPAPATEQKAAEEKPADKAQNPAESAGLTGESMVCLTDRVSFGTLGMEFITEYGLQAEVMAKHFGILARWAVFMNQPDTWGFSYDFGFAFHYYPFGDGPSGLYVGPGFTLIHIFRNPDPMRALVVPEEISKVVEFDRSGYGHQFDLLTPTVEIGYRHRFPFYLTLGAELTLGYAFSDQPSRRSSDFFWVFNPQIGVAW